MTRCAVAPLALVAAAAAAVAALACGEVPTLEGGIAYLSPVVLPAPAVAAGDTLRDSLGRAAPLTIRAFDVNDNPIANVNATYIVSTLPAGVTISAAGFLVALDSLRTVQIVGRVGDRLQTGTAALDVVPQPDSIVSTTSIDSLQPGTPANLQALVTGLRRGTRSNVKGIIVRYRITKVSPGATVNPATAFFINGIVGDLTRAVDTTDASGAVSRSVAISTAIGIESVTVEASATSLRGARLGGGPITFTLPVKKGT